MPNGVRSASVQSHRRGGARRKTSPWLVIGVVAVLLLGGVAAGWTYLAKQSCTGMDSAVIDASPSMTPILKQLAGEWEKTKPAVAGRCVSVSVNPIESAVMVNALANPWDVKANGPAPDVWVPESSVWVREASDSDTAQALMPDLQPSLARTPSVIAMPKNMATALGWPKKSPMDWPDLVNNEEQSGFWASKGQDFGAFKVVMESPATSTAGMLALMSIADRGGDQPGSGPDGYVSPAEQATVYNWGQKQTDQVGDTSDILDALHKADAQSSSGADVDKYVSAFPALETDVLKYNASDPKEPLVAVYPASGTYDADNPYLILNKPSWGSAAGVTAATAFETYARGPVAHTAYLKAGYRDSNRLGDSQFTEANGVRPTLDTSLPRAVLVPDSITSTMQAWNATTRSTNVLIVLDVSGSMANPVPGTGKTRLQLAKAAAVNAVSKFDDSAHVGLWEFSTKLDGSKPYKQLTPIGPLNETVDGGKTRRDELIDQINGLVALRDTGLYQTVDQAQKTVVANYVPDAVNLVVIMTDGEDDPGTNAPAPFDLSQLSLDIATNHTSKTPVPVVTIGLGPDADDSVLAQIARQSGAQTFDSPSGFDINKVLLSALFGAASVAG